MLAQDRSRHAVVAGFILVVHSAAIVGLMAVGRHPTPKPVSTAVEVRFVANSATQRRWEPPEVPTLVPQIVAAIPEVPLVESPVVVPSERAINVAAQVAAAPVPSVDSAPRLISSVEYLREPVPRYPPQSRKLREQGLVVLRVLIDEKGVACKIEIETSSGFTRLDRAAHEAVARAAFRPYIEDGLPRRAFVLVPIEFSLSRGSA